jgi:PAS domain S-box-containing protein
MIGSSAIHRVKSVRLKWKLLIPFLLFSFLGTTTLVYIGLTSQQELIKREEKKEILGLYRVFLTEINQKKTQALSLATVIAENPQVQKHLLEKDRAALEGLLLPSYHRLKRDYGILQFHFHIPPGQSFLRLHRLAQFGEMIAYRRAVIEAMRTCRPVGGLEWGLTGLGIRGVLPVFAGGVLVGSVEVGFPFGKPFLDNLRKNWLADFTVYEKKGRGTYSLLATTLKQIGRSSPLPSEIDAAGVEPLILISPSSYPDKSLLLGSITDYSGEAAALVEVSVDRSVILKKLSDTRGLMFFVALAGVSVSFVLIWLVASLFVRPIKEIVREAREIAEGKRKSSLHKRPHDEVGMLTESLNTMLESLQQRQLQVQEYAKTLELRVQERTADLIASEEKYRTLVENLPLIVYRILIDGTTEFVNPYFTRTLGFTAEEVVGDKKFWLEKICGIETTENKEDFGVCWTHSEDFRTERVVRSKQGQPRVFLDQAIPSRNVQGEVKWIDGIMLDITELKQLQERAIRTEEIRVLGEISARFAHEIRNPLTTAGGFARRLRDSLQEHDPNRKFAHIIVEEMAKLEDILQIILSSIEPFTLCISEVHPITLLRSALEDLDEEMKEKGIHLAESLPLSLPAIQADESLLNRAFENLLKHAIIVMPEGEELYISMSQEKGYLVSIIRHRAEGLAEEDLEQFFFPRFTSKVGAAVLELPLSKLIIHRHGGKIDVCRETENKIALKIELPIKLSDSRIGQPELTE